MGFLKRAMLEIITTKEHCELVLTQRFFRTGLFRLPITRLLRFHHTI